MILAGVLTGLEAALPFVEQWLPIPTGILAAAASLVTGGAFVARLVAQTTVTPKVPKDEEVHQGAPC